MAAVGDEANPTAGPPSTAERTATVNSDTLPHATLVSTPHLSMMRSASRPYRQCRMLGA